MEVAFGCVGSTIRLRSGLYFDLSDPREDQFTIEDIAGALSKICRFGGQIECFYSVAEHSYWCGYQAECDGLTPDEIAAVFLHDAAEAFVGDVVKPLKLLLGEFGRIERRIEGVIERKFGIDFGKHKKAIQKIDHEMLIAERRSMFSADDVQWEGEDSVRRLTCQFGRWRPSYAESAFLISAKRWVLGREKGGCA